MTAYSYASLCAWAWFLYAFGVIVPLLREQQDTSRAVAALHSTCSAAGGVVAGLLVAALVRRLQRRRAATLGAAISAAGLAVLLIGSPTALTLSTAFVAGVGGALMANVTVAVIIGHHGRAGTAALSEANGFAAGVALVAPLAVGGSVWLGWGWQPALAVYAALLGVVLWLLWTIAPGTESVDGAAPGAVAAGGVPGHAVPDDTVPGDAVAGSDVVAGPDSAPPLAPSGRLPLRYWPYVLVVMCSVGTEFTMATWSGDLVVDRAGVSAATGAAMVSLVLAGMTVGRFAVSPLTRRYAEVPLLMVAFALTFVGWFIAWTSQGLVVCAIGLTLTGLGIAGQYPLALTLCVRAAPGQNDKAVGVAGASISVAIGTAPFLLGALADASDIHAAFVVVPAMIAIAAITLVVVRSRTGSAHPGTVP